MYVLCYTAVAKMLMLVLQIKTHQYSVTHFERDLSKGNAEDNTAGVHIQHGMTGIPGKLC